MPRDAFRNPLTGAPRRAAKRWRTKNLRWMHLSTGEIVSRKNLHRCWAMHSLLASNSFFLAGYAIALRSSFIGPIPAAMQQIKFSPLMTYTNSYEESEVRFECNRKQFITLKAHAI